MTDDVTSQSPRVNPDRVGPDRVVPARVSPDRFYIPQPADRQTAPGGADPDTGPWAQRPGVGRHSADAFMDRAQTVGHAVGRPADRGVDVVASRPARRGVGGDDDVERGMSANVIVCSAPSGGIGLSVLSAMLACELIDRGNSCALVDADFLGGGLDVLLGIEHEPGMRFDGVKAPLGHVEGLSLNEQLPLWHDVRVLAFNPWNGEVPTWWEASAAIEALATVNDVVVVDAGASDDVGLMSDAVSSGACHLVAVELSVLGMARARPYVDRIAQTPTDPARTDPARIDRNRSDRHGERHRASSGQRPSDREPSGQGMPESLTVVGMHPRGAVKRARLLTVDEASQYLGRRVIGPVRHHAKLQYEILDGMGINGIFRSARPAISELAQGVERALGRRGPAREETRHATG